MARTKKQTKPQPQQQVDDLGSLFRAALNVAGGALVSKGVIASTMVEPVIGSVLTLGSLLLSWRKNRQPAQ